MESDRDQNQLVLRVTDLSRGGAGVARQADGRVVFVPLSAPGDLVRVEIVDESKRYAQGKLLEILEPSPERKAPRCAVYGRCGGCKWQHLDNQLQWKTKVSGVRHALSRVEAQVQEIGEIEEIPAEKVWEYRNRVQLRGEHGKIGFYSPGSHDLVPIERCEIARPEINSALEETRREGALLHHPFKIELEVLENGQLRKIWNSRHAAGGFRQVHDEQNEKLRSWVRRMVPRGAPVLDLFGGSGNLSVSLAADSPGIDCVDLGAPREHPEGAPRNIRFHRAPVARWLEREVARKAVDPQDGRICILDPPREGLGAEFQAIESALARLNVTRILAIGCDPDSWARDLSRFARKSWRLKSVAVLDLFPQTPHVESLAVLERGTF